MQNEIESVDPKVSYPKYRYHATKDAVLVNSPEEEAALGEDWRDSRADLEAEEGSGKA